MQVIFEGINLLNQQQVAIKFEPRKSDAPQLRDEYRTYKILVGCRELLPPLGHVRVYYAWREDLHFETTCGMASCCCRVTPSPVIAHTF